MSNIEYIASEESALGMICLELWTGTLPLIGADAKKWREWHLHGDRDAAFQALKIAPPQPILEMVRSCVEPDPALRPRDSEAVLGRLRRSIAAPPATLSIGLSSPCSRMGWTDRTKWTKPSRSRSSRQAPSPPVWTCSDRAQACQSTRSSSHFSKAARHMSRGGST